MDAEKRKGGQAPENILGGSVPQPLPKGWIPDEKVITVGESSHNILGSIVDAEKSKEGRTPENLLGESVPQDRIREDSSQEDWERRIREYRRDLEKERLEDEERNEKATKKEKSWELFRECKRFIMENVGNGGWEKRRKKWKKRRRERKKGSEK